MKAEEKALIKKLIAEETNGWNIVEISKFCQSELKKRNDGLKVLFE